MNRCPITGESCGLDAYSRHGLAMLSPRLRSLAPLPLPGAELVREAGRRVGKMSIQGVQPKLSAVLRISEGRFEIVDRGGRFILKPPNPTFPEVPQNEAATMTLARDAGVEVPDHGLVRAADGELVYFVRRFDRSGRNARVHVEDFAQLEGRSRDAKYRSSLEDVAAVVERHCTFPLRDKLRLLRRVLFCFLTGNEDMHLKNYSLMHGEVVGLTPAYDLLNTTVAQGHALEESALPVGGRTRDLGRYDLVEAFGMGRLGLTEAAVARVLAELAASCDRWPALLERSFLAPDTRRRYLELAAERRARLEIRNGGWS